MTPTRRDLFVAAASLGVGSTTFHRALAAQAPDFVTTVTPDMVRAAEWVAGLELSDEQRRQVATGLTQAMRGTAALHRAKVGNDVPPALHFLPDPGRPPVGPRGTVAFTPPAADRPATDDDLAFLPLTKLAALLREKKVSSTDLTKLYLARLKKYDPALKCVVNLTEELALRQAAEADRELAAGTPRGLLHGVPWVAKDLIAYPGTKTTWGATPFREQTIDAKATVADRIERAGGVMVAKVTLGALAMGDRWFGGMTRNPWNVRQGSSGSSAGSASAVAAGCACYGIGSETWGSITSPSTRCGVTGLRPTFGRVSRHGCMALSWSMDKLGPLARSVEDCALILSVVHGHDGLDPTAVTHPFTWPAPRPLKEIRVGFFESTPDAVKQALTDLGVRLVPFRLPAGLPVAALSVILDVEASAAFDDLTRAGVTEGLNTWPATFRRGRFVPAVDYLRAQRVRTQLMKQMAAAMTDVDVYVGSPDNGLLTNLTGHPVVCLPNGLARGADGVEVPTSLTFTGRLWGEAELLAVAKAYQDATGHHLRRPDMTKVTAENAEPKK
ncbi:amidase [Urbifossiella limnaea]|uniref:Glutamyl-tRNA(Gln) amidotransferase subunit A n=1 Tax=Urbifossiella limnaea TaxID=2528023 RepID=A0A517XQ71_9BACT|nr:amidase [Urbifossiella limnaea]QDU19653.1 Glutamyl-tRNA(Gln) amidotransferase subunit A [Urbifossiella limnaea]